MAQRTTLDRRLEIIIGVILLLAGFLQFFSIDLWPVSIIMPILVFLSGLALLFLR